MKNRLRSYVWIVMLVAWVAAAVSSRAADSVDKYGNRIYISEGFQAAQNAQSRDSLDAYRRNSQRVSGSEVENIYAQKYQELLAKEAAKQNAARELQERQQEEKRHAEELQRQEMQAALEQRRRQEREDAEIVVQDGQFMTGKEARLYRQAEAARAAEAKWAADKAAFDKTYGPLIRTAKAALEARQKGVAFVVPADSEPIAYGLVSGYFEGKKVSELDVPLTDFLRYDIGLAMYRQCDLSQAYTLGVACTASTLVGRGRVFVDRFLVQCADRKHPSNGPGNRGAYGYEEAWVTLACALATPDGKMDEAQRRLATALLAEVINGRNVDPYPDIFDNAAAALLVAAAREAPELTQLPKIRQNYISMVRKSDWSYSFKTYPVSVVGAPPLVPTALENQVWFGLAIRLVLSDRSAYPGLWFSQVRAILNRRKGFTLSVPARQTLQQALDGWFNRAQASPWLRQALQADFDLTCSMPEGHIAENESRSSDLKAVWYWDCLMRDYDAAETAGERVKRLADEDPFHSGVTGFLVHAGAPAMERYITAVTTAYRGKPDGFATWTAIQGLTNFRVGEGEKLPDLGISAAFWRKLVIAGEASRTRNARYKWDDPLRDEAHTMARIKRIRQDILGESAGELTLPEYSREPADLVESLLLLTEAGLTLEARRAVQGLLDKKEDISDPPTVMLIVRILGLELGEWSQLGTWLDDPRRRPKDRSNPLYLPYLVAIIAREQATGYWSKKAYDPAAQPVNDAERIIHQAIDGLADELAQPEVPEIWGETELRRAVIGKLFEPPTAGPGSRTLLAHAMLGAAERIRSADGAQRSAMGTGREYEVSRLPYPPTKRVKDLAAFALREKDIAPELRVVAADLMIDFASESSERSELLVFLDGLVTSESDPLVDSVAYLAGWSINQTDEDLALERRVLLRVAKAPRGSLPTAAPCESIPRVVVAMGERPPPEATLALATAFESAAVGSPERATLAGTLVTVQLTADVENPFERSTEKALYLAARGKADDGVAALAYATLIHREHHEIPWVYPPPSRLVTEVKNLSAFNFRAQQTYWYTRNREANGFAALVLAFQKKVPGARTRLSELYDPALEAEARFALGAGMGSLFDDDGSFAQIGARARLAAVGTKDAATWLERVAVLPPGKDDAGLAALYVNAVRVHPHPEVIIAELLRILWQDTAGDAERAALRTLIAADDAPRLFGTAWRDDSPSPFQIAWMLEILDQKAAQQLAMPEDDFSRPLNAESKKLFASVPEGTDVPEEVMDRLNAISDELVKHRVAYQEQKLRERLRSLSPKAVMLLAFSSARTTSELARAVVHDAPSGFIDNLAKLAAEADPSLAPLLLRFNDGAAGRKPLTAEHWALLAEGQLWPLPDGVTEAE